MLRTTREANRRREIIGAVYSYTQHLSGIPSMPIVTPRINAQMGQQLVQLMTGIPSDLSIKQWKVELAEYSRYTDTDSQRQAASLKRKIELRQATLKALSPEEAGSQIANLGLMRGLASIGVESGLVKATTAPIVIQSSPYYSTRNARYYAKPMKWDEQPLELIHLGRYDIRINLNDRVFPQSIGILRLLPDGTYDRRPYPHPHMQGTGICWGNFSATVEKLLQAGSLDLLLTMILQHLATYNVDSPYAHLYHFNTGGCYALGR